MASDEPELIPTHEPSKDPQYQSGPQHGSCRMSKLALIENNLLISYLPQAKAPTIAIKTPPNPTAAQASNLLLPLNTS